MREIKFRIWDKKYHTFDYNASPELFISTEGEVFEKDYRNFGMQSYLEYNRSDDYELNQYTGLKDKNGKEIYEGDICTIWMGVKQDNPYVVEDLRELYLDMNHADSYYRITMIEVIGNKYENPELPEKSK